MNCGMWCERFFFIGFGFLRIFFFHFTSFWRYLPDVDLWVRARACVSVCSCHYNLQCCITKQRRFHLLFIWNVCYFFCAAAIRSPLFSSFHCAPLDKSAMGKKTPKICQQIHCITYVKIRRIKMLDNFYTNLCFIPLWAHTHRWWRNTLVQVYAFMHRR